MPRTLLWKWAPPLKTADLGEEVATKLWNLLAAQRLFANETTIQCRLLKIYIYIKPWTSKRQVSTISMLQVALNQRFYTEFLLMMLIKSSS